MATQVAKKIVSSIDDTGGKTFFRRCGVAFPNKDGSLNVFLDLFPGVKLHIADERPAAKPSSKGKLTAKKRK